MKHNNSVQTCCSESTHFAGQNVHQKELNELNAKWNYGQLFKADSGLLSRIRAKLIKLLFGENIIQYLKTESDFNCNLVRFLNVLAKKLDRQELRAEDEFVASLVGTKQDFEKLKTEISAKIEQLLLEHRNDGAAIGKRFDELNSIVLGVERVAASLKHSTSNDVQISNKAEISSDHCYLMLENRFRGSVEEITNRLSSYPELFRGLKKPVLEIGAGRGELQKLFKNSGIISYGVELSSAMVEQCKSEGLDVRFADGISHLKELDNGSLGGVIAIQVVEHIPVKALTDVFSLLAQKIEKGGKVVLETINTESMVALCRNYFRDPTHVFPVHPETMKYFLELSGFTVLEVRKLAHFPESFCLQHVPTDDFMTPRWLAAIDAINRNVDVLNNLLFDAQDYCIVAEV